MRLVQCLSHSIEAYDQLRLYHSLGIEAFDIGGYINPAKPHDDKRPALPDVPYFPELQKAIDALGTDDNLGAAQAHIPDAVLDWLGDDGAIVFHHYLDRLYGQWDRIRDWKDGAPGRRVIWRSVGQSVEWNERQAQGYRMQGLERVAYSPKEANIPGYSGHDALIRFYKMPDEWSGWTGEDPVVVNFTQHLAQRDPYTNYGFWEQATAGLPRQACGPGSEVIGGPGGMSEDDMKARLRSARAYLYTGTQPASYTLGLIEAMMTGIPVVSIGPAWMRVFPYGPELFEGHELAAHWEDDPARAAKMLRDHLDSPRTDTDCYRYQQSQVDQFAFANVQRAWAHFLGVDPPSAEFAHARETVTA
jgi:glycosyltransferase involved in cell wall biosynthesis